MIVGSRFEIKTKPQKYAMGLGLYKGWSHIAKMFNDYLDNIDKAKEAILDDSPLIAINSISKCIDIVKEIDKSNDFVLEALSRDNQRECLVDCEVTLLEEDEIIDVHLLIGALEHFSEINKKIMIKNQGTTNVINEATQHLDNIRIFTERLHNTLGIVGLTIKKIIDDNRE